MIHSPDEFSRSVDIAQMQLYEGLVFIIWKWRWVKDAHCVSSSSETEVEEDSNSEICNSSYSDHEATTVNHSVVFKCIGCLKELRYQEILAEVSRKIETIPVDLRREPKKSI